MARCSANLLRKLSVGKYNTVLYHNGETAYTTAIGGILTILALTAIFIKGLIIFIGILSFETYSIA